MPTTQIRLGVSNASEAASLATWMRRNEQDVQPTPTHEVMGSGETVTLTLAGAAAFRAAMLVAREWIRAHKTSITVEIKGRGRVIVEGTTEIDRIVELLDEDDRG